MCLIRSWLRNSNFLSKRKANRKTKKLWYFFNFFDLTKIKYSKLFSFLLFLAIIFISTLSGLGLIVGSVLQICTECRTNNYSLQRPGAWQICESLWVGDMWFIHEKNGKKRRKKYKTFLIKISIRMWTLGCLQACKKKVEWEKFTLKIFNTNLTRRAENSMLSSTKISNYDMLAYANWEHEKGAVSMASHQLCKKNWVSSLHSFCHFIPKLNVRRTHGCEILIEHGKF